YNQNLSLSRAQSVVDYFVAGGIDSARLVATGAGESQPVADNETADGRAQNRRVEFAFGPASKLGG
ncbi:MAG: OmpA family protein, partial [Acidimicrobiia bacterium]|nr:OmpA family protein [Acidimicrobiia bacterium]